MLTLNLDSPRANDESHHVVRKDIARVNAQKGRIFRVFSSSGEKRYELMTTSKEICLGLVQFSKGALEHLCVLIDKEFESDQDGPLMLVEDNKSVLVTRSRERYATIIHLSPAH